MTSPFAHVPVVAGLAYIERIHQLPSRFTATLAAEPDNRFNRFAVAVLAGGNKIGYVPPEISCHYFDPVRRAAAPVECPGRRVSATDLRNTGVAVLLDFSALPVARAE